MMPLSGDRPRSAILSVALVLIVLGLALAPFLFPGAKPLNVAAKICIFIALAASYDLLLGYTGVVSWLRRRCTATPAPTMNNADTVDNRIACC